MSQDEMRDSESCAAEPEEMSAPEPEGEPAQSVGSSRRGFLWLCFVLLALWPAWFFWFSGSEEGQATPEENAEVAKAGQLIASGSYDGTIRLWNASDGRYLRTLEGHTDWVRSVTFSPR